MDSPAAKWLIVAIVWTLLAVLSIGQTALYLIRQGERVVWEPLILQRLADWYTCALFVPPLVWLARRFPLERDTWPSVLPIHFMASLVCVLVKDLAYLPVARLTHDPTLTLGELLARGGISELMTFWAISGIVHAAEFYRRYQDGRNAEARLQAELAEARLEALAMQLQPHFLFNTLGAIGELVYQDPGTADRMLADLSELLRETLRRPVSRDVTVAEEFGFIERYLGIMRVRFGPRLVVRMAVDPRAAGLRILPFVLQPLVENAVDHGIARRRGPARVSVTADLVTHDGASRLRLRVEDDGPGLGTAVAEGIGIGNTRRRLRERYGAAQELVLAEAPGGGTEVRMTIPVGSS